MSESTSDLGVSSLGVIVQSGTFASCLLSINGKKPCILDSSATNHLTRSYEILLSYLSNAGNEKIRIEDGPSTPVADMGHNSSFDGLTLQNVIHVPKLSYNLISISKITRDLNCQVPFSPNNVFFQDSISSTMMFPLGIVIRQFVVFLFFNLKNR